MAIRQQIAFISRVWVKLMFFENAGDSSFGHTHVFDHTTILSVGSVRVISENETKEYVAPCLIVIPKNVKHQIVALQDGTVASCVHALRKGDGMDDIIDADILPENTNMYDIFTQVSPLITK
jgi:hypothetical protein